MIHIEAPPIYIYSMYIHICILPLSDTYLYPSHVVALLCDLPPSYLQTRRPSRPLLTLPRFNLTVSFQLFKSLFRSRVCVCLHDNSDPDAPGWSLQQRFRCVVLLFVLAAGRLGRRRRRRKKTKKTKKEVRKRRQTAEEEGRPTRCDSQCTLGDY